MKKIGSIALLLLTLLFIYGLYDYLSFRRHNAVSDAAFVKSDAIYTLGFKVGGRVAKLLYEEGNSVKKGVLLATLDPTDYRIALEKARHTVKAMEANLQALQTKRERLFGQLKLKTKISRNDIGAGDEKLKALRYKIASLQTRLSKLSRDKNRFRRLYRKKLISSEELERVTTAYNALHKEIEAAKRELASYAISTGNLNELFRISELEATQIKEIDLSIQAIIEQIEAAKNGVRDLQNKLSDCNLSAPVSGRIAKRFVNTGRVLSKGYPVYALVDSHHKHVEVLLSEKKLHGVAPQNRVVITPDALRGEELKGHVESILPASASTFSLVPRDIASGEFTKLDQRFIVRIAFDENETKLQKVLIGMSATVAIERR